LERLAATAAAIALHGFALASLPWWAPARDARPQASAPAVIPIRVLRLPNFAVVPPPMLPGRRALGVRRSFHGALPAEVRVAEREIIDQGHGVTMTIEGEPPPPSPDPAPRWLQMDVWVAQPVVAPHPSDYCLPRKPRMPDRAIDHEVAGRVTASYLVDEDGVAVEVSVEPGAPPILARAVRDWVKGCLFVPAQQGGKRTSARVKQSFLFEIR
jgi:hypothetical protein